MRRVYSKKGKSKVRQRAMEQFRSTRDMISEKHPGLLSSIRNKLSRSDSPENLNVDRKKNLETVMKFLEIKQTHSNAFQAKLRQILQESR